MSFSIEVPAETNPLTNEMLFRILQSASSSNQQQIQTGTKQLQNWEKHPGYFSTLQAIFLDQSLPEEIRYLAILQLKNGIDKYWRKTAQNAITKDEKNIIRSRSLQSCLDEPKPWLALQSAIVISRVIRYEFPHDWPDAISSIVESLRVASEASIVSFRLPRALLMLLYVIKELSTAKLQHSRAALQTAAPGITKVLFATYLASLERWMLFLRHGGDDEGGAIESMEHSLLATRVLRRLVLQYDFPNRHGPICEIWNVISHNFDEMLSFVSGPQKSLLTAGPRSLVQRHLFQFAKMHLNVARLHPAAFALLPNSIGLARAYWTLCRQYSEYYGLKPEALKSRIGTDGDEEDGTPFEEMLTLKGLLILRACSKMAFNPIQTFKYQQAEDKDEKRIAREQMQHQLLTPHYSQEIMEVLVIKYFVFTSRDLKQWEDEPDEWEKTQEGAGDDWEFSVRTCAEKLFLDLVINYKEILVPALIEILQSGMQSTEDILKKDSIYAAIGLSAPVLEQQFDFATFLQSTLVSEIQIQGPGSNILRRRVAIVLGKWLPVKEGLDRSLVYQIFQHLLNKDDLSNDQVVRVTAGRQLHDVIDPFEFTAEGFAAFTPGTTNSLMPLIEEVELTETKLALLNTLSLIVTKMEHHISPFSDLIISHLPNIWAQAKEEYIIQQSILGIISRLVTSLQSDSLKYHAIIVPLIRSSVDPSSPTREYLLEDALDLWGSVLEQTPSPPSKDIAGLVQYLFPMYEVGSDALRKSLDITEAYIYLVPSEILSGASSLLEPFANLLGGLKREASGVVTHLVTLLIRSAHNLGGPAAVESLAMALVSSTFLPSLLKGLKDAYDAHQTTGPNRIIPSIDGIVETDYFSVLARLGVSNPSLLISAFEASMQGSSLDWLVTEWFAHMDSISSPVQKKLSCLALTGLLEKSEPWILSHLQSFMSMWTDIITELVSETEDTATGTVKKVDCLVYSSPDELKPAEDVPETPAAFRERQLLFADPVHRIDIRDFVRQELGIAIERSGGMDAFRQNWVENVDKDVVQAFGELGVF